MTETDVFNALKYRKYDANMGWYEWCNDDGQTHRDGGPAYEYDDGSKWWYQNDQLHRLDGPAFDLSTGYKEWWVNGQLHRTDGPAIEWLTGAKEYYIRGFNLTEEQFNRRIK